MYPVETTPNRYQCSSEALQDVVTLVKSDDPLYEFTATVPSRSHLITNKMFRMLFGDLLKASSYVNTTRTEEINNIISDINNITSSKL